MKYILKNNEEVETIPMGKCPIQIGTINDSGYLTVIGRVPNKNNSRAAQLLCQCKCGKYTVVRAQDFKSGTTKSCGCYNIEYHKQTCKKIGEKSYYKDYSKQDNPYYNFIKPLNSFKNSSQYWEISCKQCGKKYKEIPVFLISNTRKNGNNPCSCWKTQSKGIVKIEQLLSKNNHSYIKEKTFPTCLSPKNNNLRFDFFVDNKYLIEYDGEQHYSPTFFNQNLNAEEKFKQQQEYDNIKNQWCINNNIILIRIPYFHYKELTINDLIPETSKFIIMKETINDKSTI